MLYSDKAVYCDEDGKKHTVEVNQRQKIFTIIDFLRSTYRDPQIKFPDPYFQYHCYIFYNHGRYPLHVCENVRDKYPEYYEFMDKYEHYPYYEITFNIPRNEQ